MTTMSLLRLSPAPPPNKIPMALLWTSLAEEEQDLFGRRGPPFSGRGPPPQRKRKAVSFAEGCDKVVHLPPQIPDDVPSDAPVISPTVDRATEQDDANDEEAVPHVMHHMDHCLGAGRPSSSSSMSSWSCLCGSEPWTGSGLAPSHYHRRARLYEVVRNFQDFVDDTQVGVLPGGDLLLAEFLWETGVSASSAGEARARARRDREDVTWRGPGWDG